MIVMCLGPLGCSSGGSDIYSLDDKTSGYIVETDNTLIFSVASTDDNVLRAEYKAGFIQGKLQKNQIISARDNLWDSAYLNDSTPTVIEQIPPSEEEISAVLDVILQNFNYTMQYIQNLANGTLRENMMRLIYRLIGIYHGTKLNAPASLPFSSDWLPSDYFTADEMALGYETSSSTFMDIYFINSYYDMLDVMYNSHGANCSAFVKKTDDDVFMAHNSWFGFLDQSMAANYFINGDFFAINMGQPGLIGSGTDFGYNNKGIMFNETTHYYTYTETKTDALWMFIRAALAEQFAGSLDEFYYYLSLEASGTYMNGYMVVDTDTNEIGLVEMSYSSFVYFKPDGNNGYEVITKPEGLSQEYDTELLQPDYILGINYPVSYQIADDLRALDTSPARRTQLLEFIGDVNDIESAKDLITYTDPNEPLSIFGRWDLGYGTTPEPDTIPNGAVDAKALASSMTTYTSNLEGLLDVNSDDRSFWMKFGSAKINDKPFIWSESQWNTQKLRDVPDSIDGNFNYLYTYIR